MTDSPQTTPRETTAIDAIAEDWVTTLIDLNPDVAIWIGTEGRLGEYADLSPEGHEKRIAATRAVIDRLHRAESVDDVDRVTRTDLLTELQLSVESYEAKLHLRDVNVLASPAQEIRETFDLMPHATTSDWSTIAERLSNVPTAISGYIETLRQGIAEGVVPARRQVAVVSEQVRKHADPLGFFFDFTGNAKLEDGSAIPESLAADLKKGAEASADAYAQLADFLETELAPVAVEVDAIGRDLYSLHSRHFLGAEIDLDETYEWGIEELKRMVDEQTRIAGEIKPGASVEEAIEFLNEDASRKLNGTDELQAWMQALSDKAVDELSKSHFEIADPIKNLECMIAPTNEGGIYYTSPERRLLALGPDVVERPRGRHRVRHLARDHDGVPRGRPGHHLQLGQAVYNRAQLNTWRRNLAGTSGHAEGWALYAERLMEELGYLDDPADRLGMLDGQRMRAARVVLDIGVHLGKQKLDGSGIWDADEALRFMRANVNMNDAFVRFEVNRYLGWPGQAPSYKVGQRIWEQIRDAAQTRDGSAFSFKDFHKRALDLGGVGLDTLKAELLG